MPNGTVDDEIDQRSTLQLQIVELLAEWGVWEGHPAKNTNRHEFAQDVVSVVLGSEWLKAHDTKMTVERLRGLWG